MAKIFRIARNGKKSVLEQQEGHQWIPCRYIHFTNEGDEEEVLWLRRKGTRVPLAIRRKQRIIALQENELDRKRSPIIIVPLSDGVIISVDTVGVRLEDIFQMLPAGYQPL